MSKKIESEQEISEIVKDYYSQGGEAERLSTGKWKVEKIRTENILSRFLPKPPATIVDIEGMIYGMLKDPIFVDIVKEGMQTGYHKNPTEKLEYFTSAYYHQPDELKNELSSSGFKDVSLLGIEGPGWIMPDFDAKWKDKDMQKTLLDFLKIIEKDSSLLGVSAHIMAIGRK